MCITKKKNQKNQKSFIIVQQVKCLWEYKCIINRFNLQEIIRITPNDR